MYKKIFLLLSLSNFVTLLLFCCFHNQLHLYLKSIKNHPIQTNTIGDRMNDSKNASGVAAGVAEIIETPTSNEPVKVEITTAAVDKNDKINVKKRDIKNEVAKDNKITNDTNNFVKPDEKAKTDTVTNNNYTLVKDNKQDDKKVEIKGVTKPEIKTEKPADKIEEEDDDVDEYDEEFSSAIVVEKHQPQSYLNKSTEKSSMCPAIPPNLVGRINVTVSPLPQLEDLEKEYTWLSPGGRWSPPCIQDQNLAVIVPFRGRENQLKIFLKHMHPFLKKQQLNYTVIVTQQENDSLAFNKGQIMNTAYVEALKMSNFSCFIFHDVDLLPEDDRILYRCTKTARHLTGGIDKWNYKIMYKSLFGGVVAINKRIFKKVNGYSNKYWGWGGEDDEFKSRMDTHRVKITRYPAFARYKMIKHKQEHKNPNRYKLLDNNFKYYGIDGLSNLNTTVLSIEKQLLFTRIIVRVNERK